MPKVKTRNGDTTANLGFEAPLAEALATRHSVLHNWPSS